jgi:hypothetical protein
MTKIVYNACYGGFSLNKEEIERYKELGGTHRGPDYLIARDDPILVQVVEEGKASGKYSDLEIRDIPAGSKYRIHEYDGMEYPKMIDEYVWTSA